MFARAKFCNNKISPLVSMSKQPHFYVVGSTKDPKAKASKGARRNVVLPDCWQRFPIRLRKAYGIRERGEQTRLAKLAGINGGSFSQWLSDAKDAKAKKGYDKWKGMAVPSLIKLADALGVDPTWLMCGPGDEPVWVNKPVKLKAVGDHE
jgi:hypothetical protein